MQKKINEALLAWYDLNKRDIPWRGNKNPYYIWVSEIMCQQTRIDTVIPFYLRFIKEIPDIASLATYPIDDLYKLWQGLGYYNRVKNMQKAAIEIVDKHDGIFPEDFNSVVKLPGIGQYTAGAILSISFDKPYAAVDGNVLRVFTRLYMDSTNIALDETKKKYKELIENSIPNRSGDYNQAIMDLGATICPPNDKPKCDICPLASLCKAHLNYVEENYPVKEKKLEKNVEEYSVFLIYQNNQLLLHKRPEKGLLSNLYEFKNVEGYLSIKEVKELFKDSLVSVKKGEDKSFLFTHKKWNMKSFIIEVENYSLKENEIFIHLDELDNKYSIPTAFRQFIK